MMPDLRTVLLSATLGTLGATTAAAQDVAADPDPAAPTQQAPATDASTPLGDPPDITPTDAPDPTPSDNTPPSPEDGSEQTIRVEPIPTTVVNLDRSDWPRVTVGPADGRTSHHPTYVLDPRFWGDDRDPLAVAPVEKQLEEAMSGATAENWSWGNLGDAAAAPLVAAGELAVLPVSAIIAPPWIAVQTPPAPDDQHDDPSAPTTETEE